MKRKILLVLLLTFFLALPIVLSALIYFNVIYINLTALNSIGNVFIK